MKLAASIFVAAALFLLGVLSGAIGGGSRSRPPHAIELRGARVPLVAARPRQTTTTIVAQTVPHRDVASYTRTGRAGDD